MFTCCEETRWMVAENQWRIQRYALEGVMFDFIGVSIAFMIYVSKML